MAERICPSSSSSRFPGLTIANMVFTETKLGRGADAIVYEVEWNGTPCAAKRLHEILLEDQLPGGVARLISNFEAECMTWSKLRHPGVVQFLGVHLDRSSCLPVLVMEKMDTSLRTYLQCHSKEEFTLEVKTFVLRQVTQALAYLHSQNPPLVHHDLSPNNVLLNVVSFVTKVSDFGMSRAISSSNLTRKSSIKGTLAFMPPEALHNPPRYDEKLDVFSFGNVVLSTLTHEWPDPGPPNRYQGDHLVALNEHERREHYVAKFTVQEKQLFLPIVCSCLENRPDKRLSSVVLVQELRYIESSLTGDQIVASIEQLRQQLSAKEEECRQKDEALRQKDEALGEKDKVLRDNNEALKEKDEALRERDEVLREKDEALRQKDEALGKKDKMLRENDEALKEKDEALREKDEALRQKDEALGEKNKVLRENDEVLKEKDEALRERDEVLREKDEALRQKDEALGEKDEVLRKNDEALKEKDEALRESEEGLREKDEALRQKDEVLGEKDKVLRENDEALKEKDEALRKREEALREKDEALRQKDEALGEKDEALKEKDRMAQTNNQQLRSEIRQQLAAMEEECRRKDEVVRRKSTTIRVQEAENQLLKDQLAATQKVKHSLRDWRKLEKCQKVIQHRPEGGRYRAVAVNSEGLLAVPDGGNKCVHLLSKDGALIRSIEKGVLGGDLCGVAFDLKGNVWVADMSSKKVLKLSHDGQVLLTIHHAASKSDSFGSPQAVSIRPEGKIYICDRDNHRVTIHDEEGKFLFSFGSKGSSPGCFDRPLDVTFSSDGDVYVTDKGNKRVCEWSKEGNYKRHFNTNYVPTCIAATSDDRLVVTSLSSNMVMVYTLGGELVHEFGGRGSVQGKFDGPQGICVDADGLVYVADYCNKYVQVF